MNVELKGRGRQRVLHVFDSTIAEDCVVVAIVGERNAAALHLTEQQVRELRNQLGAWLDRNKPEPVTHRACRGGM